MLELFLGVNLHHRGLKVKCPEIAKDDLRTLPLCSQSSPTIDQVLRSPQALSSHQSDELRLGDTHVKKVYFFV
jgi:hypothetical protein